VLQDVFPVALLPPPLVFPTALMPSTAFLDATLFDTTYPVELMSIPSTPFLSVRFPDTGVVPEPGIIEAMSMPSLLVVAAKATMSGTGVAEAENSSVLSPGLTRAGLVLIQAKLNCTSIGAIAAVGVNEITKL